MWNSRIDDRLGRAASFPPALFLATLAILATLSEDGLIAQTVGNTVHETPPLAPRGFDPEYVRRLAAIGDAASTLAIKRHCAMWRVSMDDALTGAQFVV